MAWTTDDLVSSVRVRCRIPDGNVPISSADILTLAYEEQIARLEPIIRRARGDRRVASSDTSLVSGTAEYRIPTRAMAHGLRDIKVVTPSGDEVECPEIPMERVGRYAEQASPWWPSRIAHAIRGDKVVVVPTPSQTGYSLRFYYYRRPSRLIQVSQAALIDSTGGAPTYPASGGTGDVDSGDTVDVVQASPDFDWLATDLTATVSGTDITLSETVSEASAGDYICEAETTCLPQVPAEAHAALIACTVPEVLLAIGEGKRAAAAEAARDRKLGELLQLLTPRNEGPPRVLVPTYSKLRGGGWRR